MGRDRASRPEAKPLRLFVAADIPPEHARAIEETVAPWRDRLPGGRWDPSEKWHVTLKFLGRTWPRLLPWVRDVCREAAGTVRPFEVSLAGLGVFPSPSRARVLWVGVEDPAGGLARLAGEVEGRLAKEFPPEKRRFTAHLTVARFREPVRAREHADELAAARVAASPFAVDRIVLYRSHLSPRGSRYEALEAFPLAD